MRKNEMAETRDVFWQYVRGLCIICVVLIHCKNGIEFKDSLGSAWNFHYWLIMRQFINLPVAIFIFLAGYFTKPEAARKYSSTYIYGRGRRLLLPFLVWSTIYTLIHVIASRGAVDIPHMVARLLFGLSSAQLYFILVLVQLTLITPFLLKAIQMGSRAKLLFLVTPVYLLCIYLYSAVYKVQLPFYQTIFPAWFVFYYAGLWIKIKGYHFIFPINLAHSVLWCCLAILLGIVEAYGLVAVGFPLEFAISQIKMSSFLYAFIAINLLMRLRPYVAARKIDWLKYVGDNAYGIYFVHCFWLLVLAKLLTRLAPTIGDILPPYHMIQAVSAIGLSLASIIIANKVLGKEYSNRLLGF